MSDNNKNGKPLGCLGSILMSWGTLVFLVLMLVFNTGGHCYIWGSNQLLTAVIKSVIELLAVYYFSYNIVRCISWITVHKFPRDVVKYAFQSKGITSEDWNELPRKAATIETLLPVLYILSLNFCFVSSGAEWLFYIIMFIFHYSPIITIFVFWKQSKQKYIWLQKVDSQKCKFINDNPNKTSNDTLDNVYWIIDKTIKNTWGFGDYTWKNYGAIYANEQGTVLFQNHKLIERYKLNELSQEEKDKYLIKASRVNTQTALTYTKPLYDIPSGNDKTTKQNTLHNSYIIGYDDPRWVFIIPNCQERFKKRYERKLAKRKLKTQK